MPSRRPPALLALAALVGLATAVAPAASAQATPLPEPTVLAEGLIGPLHVSVGAGKTVTVSESFGGKLTNVPRKGEASTLYTGPEGWDVAGTDHQGSTTYFLESIGAGPDPAPMEGALRAIDAKGQVRTITDQIAAYEEKSNPDGTVLYGLSTADVTANPSCVDQLETIAFPVSYHGEVDSHPYALDVVGNTAYVADAGINAVLAINLKSGRIGTLAVLPARPALITEAAGDAFGIPACVGLTYGFESVPTDVVMGADGWLYVSTLPGGPEDASLGARGAVFRVNPANGATEVFVEGVLSPTGLTFDGSGNLYIASLFGEGVLKVPAGSRTASLFLGAPMVSDVEVAGSTLYATTEALFPTGGKLLSVKLR